MAVFSGSDDVKEVVFLPLPLVFAVLCLRGCPTIPQTGFFHTAIKDGV